MKIRNGFCFNKLFSVESSCNLFDLVGSECVVNIIMQSLWLQDGPGQVFTPILCCVFVT